VLNSLREQQSTAASKSLDMQEQVQDKIDRLKQASDASQKSTHNRLNELSSWIMSDKATSKRNATAVDDHINSIKKQYTQQLSDLTKSFNSELAKQQEFNLSMYKKLQSLKKEGSKPTAPAPSKASTAVRGPRNNQTMSILSDIFDRWHRSFREDSLGTSSRFTQNTMVTPTVRSVTIRQH
jgi:hypothetical protein